VLRLVSYAGPGEKKDGRPCRPRLDPAASYFTATNRESFVGVKKTGKGRRKIGRKKRRMRAKIRHRK
jgi:hypothetical protein